MHNTEKKHSIIDQLKVSWKLVRLFFHLFTGLLLAVIFLRARLDRDSTAASLFTWWNRTLCSIFNPLIVVSGKPVHEASLIVMNHISWFDIPVLGSQYPMHFLSKAEVRQWPLIGWLASRAGTLFIHRGNRGSSQQSLLDIVACLQGGGSVVVFPEGTTTDGRYLKNFHARLFQAALDAKVKIQPVALRYPSNDGVNLNVPYIDDMTFMDSVFGLVNSHPLKVELHFLTPIDPHIAPATEDTSRKTLARLSREAICRELQLNPEIKQPLSGES